MTEDKPILGRPTKYKGAETDRMAYEACRRMGASDKDLAALFAVDETTINEWRNVHDSFSLSLIEGKDEYDSDAIEVALRRRAIGYKHKSEKIFMDKEGEIVRAETVQEYPPDTKAISLWLTNRRASRWKEKQEIEHKGNVVMQPIIQEENKSNATKDTAVDPKNSDLES